MNNQSNLTSNKKFGYFFSIIFFLLSVYFFSLKIIHLFYFFIILSIIFFIVSFFKDYWLKELNNSWFNLGLLLSRIISPLIISIIFYFLIVPFGLIKSIINKIQKTNNKTTWRDCNKTKSNFENPF